MSAALPPPPLVSNISRRRRPRIRESTGTVDIGYHYVGVNSSGQPLDSEGDGVLTIVRMLTETVRWISGETDWQPSTGATDLGLRVIITEPKNELRILP